MNTFLKTYRLALTPLSPIHIGCGEDFEPTNYVIDEGILYGFDPSRAVLNDLQRSKLNDASNQSSPLAIQKFFKDHTQIFKVQAETLIPVSQGVAKVYEQCVGRAATTQSNGIVVFNRLYIERTSYTGPLRQPYIPGSSFKGALRTAWLDKLNDQRQPNDVQFSFKGEAGSTSAMEKRLFKGEFETSPLRLLKIADLMPSPRLDPARRVLYAVNLKKKKIVKDGQEMPHKGVATRKECILHGQFRAFWADAVLPSLDPHTNSTTTPAADMRLKELRHIANYANAYNQNRLQHEISLLDGRGMLNPAWKQGIERLMAGQLGAKLRSGDAFLIRLGRYGGAESKTLSGTGVAQIKIMGAKREDTSFESSTKTVWLAAENDNEQKHLLPFGWAIVEIDPQEGDLPQLKTWCESEAQGRQDMGPLRQQLKAMAAQAVAREAIKKAEQLAATQRVLALQTMTLQNKQIEVLRHSCQEWAKKMPPNGNFKKQDANPAKAGLFQDANTLVTAALNGPDWSALDRQALADMLEQYLPQVVAPWEKDQRKKLKLTALRGQ